MESVLSGRPHQYGVGMARSHLLAGERDHQGGRQPRTCGTSLDDDTWSAADLFVTGLSRWRWKINEYYIASGHRLVKSGLKVEQRLIACGIPGFHFRSQVRIG